MCGSSQMPLRQLSLNLGTSLLAGFSYMMRLADVHRLGVSKHFSRNDCTEITGSCWVSCMHLPERKG